MPSLNLSFPGPPGVLGSGQGGLKLARSLSGAGWEVTTISPPGRATDGVQSRHVDVSGALRLALLTPARYREDWLLNLGNRRFDRAAAAQINPADAFYGYSQAALLSLRRARALGAVTVVHAATTHLAALRTVLQVEYRRLGLRFPPVNPAAVRRTELEYAEADLIRAQSTLVANSLTAAGISPAKVFLVAPAVDLEQYQPAAHHPDQFTAAFVGAFSVRKGVHVLLDAWSRLPPGTGRLLLHGGAGTRWARLLTERAAARPDVELRAGPPARTYRDASIGVVPSLEDGFCYVVLEAMASGLPVVVTDQVGARDVVTEGSDGFVLPAGDAAALAALLEQVSREPERLARMGRAARVTAERFGFAGEGAALDRRLRAAL